MVVVEARTFEAAKAYASPPRAGAARLAGEVPARVLPHRSQAFEGRQLLYLSTEKLREIRDKIFDHQEFMESFAARSRAWPGSSRA